MKESEARTKWCPHVRVVTGIGKPVNRDAIKNDNFLCIASDCMMWRETKPMTTGVETRLCPLPLEIKTLAVEIEAEGYCGLAGKP